MDGCGNEKRPDSELLWALASALIGIKCSSERVINRPSSLHLVSLWDRYICLTCKDANGSISFLTPHQSKGTEDSLDARLKQEPVYDSVRFVWSSDSTKQSKKWEADSQMLQLIQAWEGFFGHRANLVPLQESRKQAGSVKKFGLSFIIAIQYNKLTVFSSFRAQKTVHSCLQWSRRFHYSGDPFK